MTIREISDIVVHMYGCCQWQDACEEVGCEKCEEAVATLIELAERRSDD